MTPTAMATAQFHGPRKIFEQRDVQQTGDRQQTRKDRHRESCQRRGQRRSNRQSQRDQHAAQHDWCAATAGTEAAMGGHAACTMTHRHAADRAGEQVGHPKSHRQAPRAHPLGGDIAEVGAGRIRGGQTRVGE